MVVRVGATDGDGRGDEELERALRFFGVSFSRRWAAHSPCISFRCAFVFGLGLEPFLPRFFFGGMMLVVAVPAQF